MKQTSDDLNRGIKFIDKSADLVSEIRNAGDLQEFLANNMDDIPDIPYNDLYMLYSALSQLKYALIALLGKELT